MESYSHMAGAGEANMTPSESRYARRCHECDCWSECPSGCGQGWCSVKNDHSEADEECTEV